MNSITLDKIAELIGGELNGDKKERISSANTIQEATAGEITFLANHKYKKWLKKTTASCVIVDRNIDINDLDSYIRVDNPVKAFRQVIEKIYEEEKKLPFSGISEQAGIGSDVKLADDVHIDRFTVIEDSAKIGKGSAVYANCYIGKGVHIGENCIIYPGVKIMEGVNLGDNVIIHSGSVIGDDGFGYSTENGKHIKVPQVGGVKIGDRVEIGSNVSIDSGSPGDTVIDEGTKIDNLVQIAHNVKIGKNCLIIAQVGIAGSTVIGDSAVLAGQAGVVGHIKVGKGAQVGAQAGVTRDIEPGQAVSGYPATDHKEARKKYVLMKKLPQLYNKVEKIAKKIENAE
ncbi:MAG: UDP-3-O-(3-hydroxymyristoyl)glucosamine N-acyltransferase [Elusimicrobiota bacterium]